jgi:hypothetical protein
VSFSPPLSVAVSRNSIQGRVLMVGRRERAAGHPVEVLDRVRVAVGWVAQWCRISDQDSLVAGSVPSCGSLAWPEKPIVSPTVQVRVGAGVSMTAVGGELPAVIVTEAGSLTSPRLSVTFSLAV